jgi:hypothetical protein
VRSKKATKTLKKAGAAPEQIIQGSTTDADAVSKAMEGCDAVVLCTSAVPQVSTLTPFVRSFEELEGACTHLRMQYHSSVFRAYLHASFLLRRH